MSVEDEVEPMSSAEAVTPVPKRSNKLPTSPLRVYCVGMSYFKQKPETEHMPWARQKDLVSGIGDEFKESDKNGFIQGQKLEHHKLKEMFDQDEEVIPKCMGRNRVWMEDDLYPQYGNLKDTMFKPRQNQPKNVLKRKREELIQGMKTLREELIRINCKYKGPWTPGTEEWKKAAGKVEKVVEEERPKDEMDELQEEVEGKRKATE